MLQNKIIDNQISEKDYLTNKYLSEIKTLDLKLTDYFNNKLVNAGSINRKLVSFQSNKKKSKYRWYKYKEAFSSDLVLQFLNELDINDGIVFDPFAGAGTTLFSSCESGLDSEGIELLPICHNIIDAGKITRFELNDNDMHSIEEFLVNKLWEQEGRCKILNEVNITFGAYPKDTKYKIQRYLHEIELYDEKIYKVLLFSLLCVLEEISYTRKDGQYLRWDYRANKKSRSKFDKGEIKDFNYAICGKLREVIEDCSEKHIEDDLLIKGNEKSNIATIKLDEGSCLNLLPKIDSGKYKFIFTSPPYCNRYDYTRTYALELALLGLNDKEIINLRQELLSCTVENKAKLLLSINKKWQQPIEICQSIKLYALITEYLYTMKKMHALNNSGIARLVENYFIELSCVIYECYRVLEKNGTMIMVNDNVRFAGASISVDLILSTIAEKIGFHVDKILTLSQVKGNSSQQMGRHGREGLRKCIYVWRKID